MSNPYSHTEWFEKELPVGGFEDSIKVYRFTIMILLVLLVYNATFLY